MHGCFWRTRNWRESRGWWHIVFHNKLSKMIWLWVPQKQTLRWRLMRKWFTKKVLPGETGKGRRSTSQTAPDPAPAPGKAARLCHSLQHLWRARHWDGEGQGHQGPQVESLLHPRAPRRLVTYLWDVRGSERVWVVTSKYLQYAAICISQPDFSRFVHHMGLAINPTCSTTGGPGDLCWWVLMCSFPGRYTLLFQVLNTLCAFKLEGEEWLWGRVLSWTPKFIPWRQPLTTSRWALMLWVGYTLEINSCCLLPLLYNLFK